MSKFKALSYTTLPKETSIQAPEFDQQNSVNLNAPSLTVMTDLRTTRPFCVSPTTSIRRANDKMIACGVRLLFVVNGADYIYGIITSNDILGEKPINYIHEHGGNREDILVQDVMCSTVHLEALDFDRVKRCRVGDIVETFQQHGRQHILVYAKDNKNNNVICGLFSSTQIERQTGHAIEITPRANTFAELEMAIAH